MKRVYTGSKPHQLLQKLAVLGGQVRCDDVSFVTWALHRLCQFGLVERCYVLTEEGRQALARPHKPIPPKPKPRPEPPALVDLISSPPWPAAHAPVTTDEAIERVRADALAARNLT
jgi:hypothetical protein